MKKKQMKLYFALIFFVWILSGCDAAGPSGGGSGGFSGGAAGGGGYGGGDGTAQIEPGTLTAGDIDDNLNIDSFSEYVNSTVGEGQTILPNIYVEDRITIHAENTIGEPLSQFQISITPKDLSSPSISSFANSSGNYFFFPTMEGFSEFDEFTITITSADGSSLPVSSDIDLASLAGNRAISTVIPNATTTLPTAMDLMLVIDTTGSMSDELTYLQTELQSILNYIELSYPGIDIRFSLIVYRDDGDNYVVRNFSFTDDIQLMLDNLSSQNANGGGDYPEAMDKALNTAMQEQWRTSSELKLLFLLADAPPHNDKLQITVDTFLEAKSQGIHIHSIAASGVSTHAEYVMRSLSVLTGGRYIFLTDDSGVGNPHEEPDVPCYVVTALDDLISRIIESELLGTRIEPSQENIIRTEGSYVDGVCAPQA